MHPTPIILLGGFLGSGKTTLIAHLLQHFARQHKRVAVVTNDQAANLVDTALLASISPDIAEVAGACFCCSFDNFISQLKHLNDSLAPDLLIGEPVGSCTDLAATVVNPLKKFYADLFHATPFSVLVDPARYRDAFAPPHLRPFPDDITYIYRLQIEEADAILLNKTDLLSPAELESLKTDLTARYPNRPIFPISAATGQGIDPWLNFILANNPTATHIPKIDYDRYAAGEAALAWLNLSATLNAPTDTNWPNFARSLLEKIRDQLSQHSAQIAHAKLLLTSPTGTLGANLTTNISAPTLRGHLPPSAHAPTLLLNLRAHTTPEILKGAAIAALKRGHDSFSPFIPNIITSLAAFSPARPNPTHRLTESY